MDCSFINFKSIYTHICSDSTGSSNHWCRQCVCLKKIDDAKVLGKPVDVAFTSMFKLMVINHSGIAAAVSCIKCDNVFTVKIIFLI